MICGAWIFAGSVQRTSAQTTYATDFQLWNDTQFIVPLDKKKEWNAVIWVFGRLGNTVRTVTDSRAALLITKKINKYATVGGGYMYRHSNTTFRQDRFESRYLGMAAFTIPLSSDQKWKLANRNIYQYENRYSRPNAAVLRSRLWLKRSVKLGGKKYEPFIAFEPMFDTRLKQIARYRTQVGFSRDLTGRFSTDIYYVRQDETGNGTRPGTLNGIGSSFRVHL